MNSWPISKVAKDGACKGTNLEQQPFYRTSFSKHLHSLARSNYFAQRLDADDRQFLEYVKRHGSANGNLPGNSAVLLEELEFWHLPFTVAPGVERRVGKRPRLVETEEASSARQLRTNAWHARRAIKEQEKKIAEAELEREKIAWENANRERRRRELMSDLEWEAFAPPRKKWGAIIDRHYVPQWKLDERRERKTAMTSNRAAIIEKSAPGGRARSGAVA